jgi:hypothetical protein
MRLTNGSKEVNKNTDSQEGLMESEGECSCGSENEAASTTQEEIADYIKKSWRGNISD